MKKHILIFVIFLSAGSFLSNALGQSANPGQSRAIPRKPMVSNQTVVDVRPQIAAILNRKRDGKFLLYTDTEGRKAFLSVKGGKPAGIEAFDKGGIALTAANRGVNAHKSSAASEVCCICFNYTIWGAVVPGWCLQVRCSPYTSEEPCPGAGAAARNSDKQIP